MACGLPVVTLNLGGPGQLVNDHCGRVVEPKGLSAAETISKLADALEALARNPQLTEELHSGALARSHEFAWKKTIAKVWGERGLGYQAVTHHHTEDIYARA
jgi:glycosyltransferase involved in cell wall biosynthesis